MARNDATIRIPSSAIRVDGSSPLVWIVDGQRKTVHARPVNLEGTPVPGGSVIVTQGVNPGDRVVVAGVHKLEEGQPVRIDEETTK